MLNSRVAYSCNVILLLDSCEILQIVEIISSLGLEDSAEVFLSLVKIIERCSLVHTILSNSSPSSKYDVEISDCVIEHLYLVEDIVTIDTISEVDLR